MKEKKRETRENETEIVTEVYENKETGIAMGCAVAVSKNEKQEEK